MNDKPDAKTLERRGLIGTLLVTAAVLFALGAIWKWALTGMSREVGQATAVTCIVLLGVGVLFGTSSVGDDSDQESAAK